MANCNTQQLNITCGTDVVLHDRLIFEGETFDPNLSVGIAANLVSSLGKRTALDVQVVDDELLISVPWIDGTLPGCYGLEVTGSCNSKKWATYADSLIKYTKATRIGVSEVTVESDSYDITQEVGYCYSNSPVTFAEVTVDEGYGTPSVDVEYEQRKLRMDFHNLKGNGITDIEVDEQVGDEAVNTVTIKTDADQEGTEFKVRNGRRGNGIASSSEVLSDQDGGTNTFTITDDDGTVHEFHSKNGTKGSQGDSAVYNPEDPDTPDFVMANTTGQSTTKAMTQKAVTKIIGDIKREIVYGETEDEIVISDDNDNYVGHINNDGAVFKGLRVGDKTSSEEVITTPVSQEFNNDESGNLEIADDNGIFVGEINNEGLIIKNLKIGDKIHGFDIMQHSTLQLSNVLNDNDLFIEHDKLINATGTYKANNGFSASSFVNIDGIVLIEYIGLHPLATYHDVYSPILLYDENFSIISPIYMAGSGKVYMSDYPDAKYAVFNNNGDDSVFEIKMYAQSEQIKAKRNDIKVGAYYFAGWSEIDFPNIHHTEALLNIYAEREPSWGWLDHSSIQGDGWLITPEISLGSGISTLTLLHSCLFYKEGQCSVCVREVGSAWNDFTPILPSSTKTTMTSTNIDLSPFSGKHVQIGFHLHTSPGDESAIWTINRLTVVSGGSTVYDKNYTNHSNFDCEITNNDVWKPATWTRAYDTLNGYVGSTVNQKDTSVIDKQIILAKKYGIDYFMLEWFYYDDRSTFNEEASYNEDNHIAVHAFMKSCQKYGFNFALMITNHSPFRIVGLQNWKDAIAYLDREYFHDPSYLIVDNKPVLYVFDKTEYRNVGPANINDYFIELGWDGVYMLFANYNTIPNSRELIERDIDDLYQQNKTWNETNYVNSYLYNFVTTITCGWDSRPWSERPDTYARPTDWFVPDINKWRAHFDWAYRFAKIYSNSLFKSVLICAWNEYGEGSYLAPTKKDSSMLRVINDVISNNKK